MNKLTIFLIMAGLIIGLVGCNSNSENTTDEPPSTEENTDVVEDTNETEEAETESNTEGENGPERPLPNLEEQKTVDMMLEGMTEKKVVNVHHHRELGFSTYVPDDMVVEPHSAVFEVFTNFGGTRNEDATLKITNQTEAELTDELEANGFTFENPETESFEFSNLEYNIQKEGMIGRAVFFQHNDKDYALYYYYPEEMADGFGPRSSIIVNEIVWHDEQ